MLDHLGLLPCRVEPAPVGSQRTAHVGEVELADDRIHRGQRQLRVVPARFTKRLHPAQPEQMVLGKTVPPNAFVDQRISGPISCDSIGPGKQILRRAR